MGSNSSQEKPSQDTSQYGQIYLETDKTAYQAGETVTGKIFLNLISHYPGNHLFLKIKGKEVVHLVKRTLYGKTYEEKHSFEEKEIIKEDTLVYSWVSLLPGNFTIPFSFLLPERLPPSFHQQGPRYFAFIEYQLEAFLKPHQKEIPKMKSKQTIKIQRTFIQTGNLTVNIMATLKTEYCCPKGSNILRVNFEKNHYSPEENAQVSVVLDNSEAKLHNLAIVLSLKQKLEVKAKDVSLSFDLSKVEEKALGIPAGSKKGGSLNITLPRSATEHDFGPIPDIDALINLRENPSVTTSNTKGSLITSEFFLEVSCPMDGCCAPLPCIEFPINILSPNSQLPALSAPLDNWQSVHLNSVALAFPSDMHQSLLSEYNNNFMSEDQRSRKSSNQANTEMAEIPMPRGLHNSTMQTEKYDQNYYKKF